MVEPVPTFDYVIVGAGSAGCVLAARLSEDPDTSVLLVEAGPTSRPEHTMDPVLWPTEVGGTADWAYSTVPQAGLYGRSVIEPHGRMVGGSSSLNGMMWTRGHPSDFDTWAHDGAPGWGFAQLEPYFRRVENCVDDPAPHLGHDGPVYLQHRGFRGPHPAARDFVTAAEKLGLARLDNFDQPDASAMLGTGFFQSNVRDGRRFGAREAYLLPAMDRPNLTLRPDTRALRLTFDGSRCTGVVLERDGAMITAVAAAREVVLSASTVETPHLLLLSGIGPAAQLRAHGVDVRVDLPGVGANLHDHVMVVLRYTLAHDVPPPEFAWEAGLFAQSDPGWIGPDLEVIFNPTGFDQQQPGAAPNGMTMVCAVLRPTSRGAVTLADADPHTAPRIDPALLHDEADARRLAQAARLALTVAGTDPLAGWIGSLADPALSFDVTDRALATWVRATAQSQWHIAGTARMGLDAHAVVDPQLRVHGVDGLRVVDVSVLPRVVSGHCQAAVFAIAERASDLLRDREPAQPTATGHTAAVPVPGGAVAPVPA